MQFSAAIKSSCRSELVSTVHFGGLKELILHDTYYCPDIREKTHLVKKGIHTVVLLG